MYRYVCVCVFMCMYRCVWVYVCVFMCMCVYVCVCMCVYVYVCVCVCVNWDFLYNKECGRVRLEYFKIYNPEISTVAHLFCFQVDPGSNKFSEIPLNKVLRSLPRSLQ